MRPITVLVWLTLAAPATAQQYSFRYYGSEDGLTNAAVKVLFQSRSGFVWAEPKTACSATTVSGFNGTGHSMVFRTTSR